MHGGGAMKDGSRTSAQFATVGGSPAVESQSGERLAARRAALLGGAEKLKNPALPEAMGGRLRIRFAGSFVTANGASLERVKVYADRGDTSQQAAIA